MSRTHLAAESTGPLAVAICGQFGVAVTSDHAAVTCRACAKALAKQASAGAVEPPDAAQAFVEALAAGDAPKGVSGPAPFVVDRDRWRRLLAHCNCGSCDVCRHTVAVRIEQHTAPYRSRMRARTEVTPPRWSSPSAALETYVAHKLDGYPIKAWGGTLEMVSTLGRIIQGEGAYASAAERAAHDVVHVESALRTWAAEYAGERHAGTSGKEARAPQHLGAEASVGILLACGVGQVERTQDAGRTVQRYVPMEPGKVAAVYGLRESDVRAMVRAGRTRVGELLAARGLVARRAS